MTLHKSKIFFSSKEKEAALQQPMSPTQEYVHTVTSQMRCKKARALVADEITAHIDDQYHAYLEEGMDPDQALRESIRQMGDGVSVGAEMDRIHRPKPDWKLILLVGIFSLLGLLLQYSAAFCHAPYGTSGLYGISLVLRHILYMGAGIGAMAAIYFLDYTLIGKHCHILWWALFLLLLLSAVFTPKINGVNRYIKLYSYLFVPLYGGILYKARLGGWRSLFRCVFYALSALLLVTFAAPSIRTAFSLCLIFLALIVTAAFKNWFSISRRLLIPLLTAGPLCAFILWFFLAFQLGWLAEYQKARILALFHMIYEPYGISYLSESINRLMEQWNLIGGTGQDISGIIPGISYDYVLTFLFTSWGILPGLAVIGGYCLLFFRIFSISLRQPNRLGMIVGLSCSLALAEQALCYLISNLGYVLLSPISMPFLSFGLNTTLITYILIGILLSIYRYKDIVAEPQLRKKPG